MLSYPPLDPSFPRGRFRGRVYDPFTQLPLSSAVVWVSPFSSNAGLHYDTPLGNTDQNGLFDFPGVPMGDYYTYSVLGGYVSEISKMPYRDLMSGPFCLASPAVRDAALQKVFIRGNELTSVEIPLEVGGSITGRVTWQNGAPAECHPLEVMVVDPEARRYVVDEAKTNADGTYHIDDLYTGRYIVGAKTRSPILYDRKSGYPNPPGPATIKCFTSIVWNDGALYYNEVSPISVTVRATVTGVDFVIPQHP